MRSYAWTRQPDLLDTLRVQRNGTDVTAAFSAQDGGLVGLVDGLAARQERADGRHAPRDASRSRI